MAPETPPLLPENLIKLQATPESIRQILEATQDDFGLRQEPGNDPNLFFRGTALYGGTSISAQSEAEVASLMEGRKPNLVVFFGLGLGYHLNQIRQRTQAPVVIFEPSLDLAAYVLSRVTIDLEQVYLATDKDGFSDTLGSLLGSGLPDIVAGALPSSRRLFPREFEEFREMMESGIKNRLIDHKTKQKFAVKWVENLAGNLPALGTQKSLSALGRQFAGKPAIVIGAGPSLDRNLEDLARAKGHALLIAAHTAIIPLARAGITPDLAVIIEGQKLDHYFSGVANLEDMVLLPSPQTHPVHLTLGFKDHLGLVLEGNAAADWLAQAYGERPLPTGGSVACAAFSAAQELGCDPLVCVGMDLSYADGRSHALGTEFGCCDAVPDPEEGVTRTHCREGRHSDWVHPTTMCTAWGGKDQVACRSALAAFRHWFEDAARTWLGKNTLINANGIGSRIRGFQEWTLAEVLTEYCAAPLPAAAMIDQALARAPRREPSLLAQTVSDELQMIRAAAKAAEHAADLAAKAIGLLEKKRFRVVQPVLDELATAEGKLQGLTRRTRLLNTLVGYQAQMVAGDKKTGDQVAQTIASLRKSRTICALVTEGASDLLAMFTPALKALEGIQVGPEGQPVLAMAGKEGHGHEASSC